MARAKAYMAQRLLIDGKHRKVLPAYDLEARQVERSLSGRKYVLVMLDVDDASDKEAWYGWELPADEARKLGAALLRMADALEHDMDVSA